ncbi:MAG: galactose mutarotase [Muribaculaceae bacterium]|nr:galactose mutarotase [Muribaculaceae bacterium]
MVVTKQIVISPIGDITIYKLTNSSGASVDLSSLGAGINSIIVPDKNGEMRDVVLGYADARDYINDGPCAGKVPGRYANRIAGGHLAINGKLYQLNINNGPNALHGGPGGFQNRIWEHSVTGDTVTFTRLSEDGEEHYPGNLKVKVEYQWSEDNTLSVKLSAVSDSDTVINLTNHSYFNLDGENAGTVLNHKLKLACSQYLPTDSTLIPTGEYSAVCDTPMDFSDFKELGKDIKADFPALNYGKGYDNCWVIDGWKKGKKQLAATLKSEKSGIELDVYTTQPAAQVYTGNWLSGSPKSKSGNDYNDYDGVAIECQGMPDAPNQPQFPSQLYKAGEEYNQIIEFVFKNK